MNAVAERAACEIVLISFGGVWLVMAAAWLVCRMGGYRHGR